METTVRKHIRTSGAVGSYRTYEEWKRKPFKKTYNYRNPSSYRTYEEWKRRLPSSLPDGSL